MFVCVILGIVILINCFKKKLMMIVIDGFLYWFYFWFYNFMVLKIKEFVNFGYKVVNLV